MKQAMTAIKMARTSAANSPVTKAVIKTATNIASRAGMVQGVMMIVTGGQTETAANIAISPVTKIVTKTVIKAASSHASRIANINPAINKPANRSPAISSLGASGIGTVTSSAPNRVFRRVRKDLPVRKISEMIAAAMSAARPCNPLRSMMPTVRSPVCPAPQP